MAAALVPSLLLGAALLGFLAAPAGAGVVATHLRLGALDRARFEALRVQKLPIAVFSLELALLVMVVHFAISFVLGVENDRSLVVILAACFAFENFQAHPL
jgi:hypothetical protein